MHLLLHYTRLYLSKWLMSLWLLLSCLVTPGQYLNHIASIVVAHRHTLFCDYHGLGFDCRVHAERYFWPTACYSTEGRQPFANGIVWRTRHTVVVVCIPYSMFLFTGLLHTTQRTVPIVTDCCINYTPINYVHVVCISENACMSEFVLSLCLSCVEWLCLATSEFISLPLV